MSDLGVEFLRQNNWANEQIIDFCEKLDDAVLDATVEGTRGKLRDTMIHMIASLNRYHLALTGSLVDPASPVDERKPWPGFADLRRAAREFGEALLRLAEAAPDGWEVRSQYQGKEWRLAGSMVLAQAFSHCTDHRSQIATILTQAGVRPPELDAWAWGAATGHMKPAG